MCTGTACPALPVIVLSRAFAPRLLFVAGMSGGQKARTALARAVYARARVSLLDDPLCALDPGLAAQVRTAKP